MKFKNQQKLQTLLYSFVPLYYYCSRNNIGHCHKNACILIFSVFVSVSRDLISLVVHGCSEVNENLSPWICLGSMQTGRRNVIRYESRFTIKLPGLGRRQWYWLGYCVELLFSRHINYTGKTLLAEVRAASIRNSSKSYDSNIYIYIIVYLYICILSMYITATAFTPSYSIFYTRNSDIHRARFSARCYRVIYAPQSKNQRIIIYNIIRGIPIYAYTKCAILLLVFYNKLKLNNICITYCKILLSILRTQYRSSQNIIVFKL